MSCNSTTWIIRHELVYFGPFSMGLFSGWAHFLKVSEKRKLALSLFLLSKILKTFWPFSENKPGAYSQ